MPDKDFHYTGYNRAMRDTARTLRKEMTRHEKHLWYDFLKLYPVHCYRQRSIDRFIVDFYIPSAKLVIEIDGSQHYTTDGQLYDSLRTDILEQYGLAVLRFSNWQIDHEFNAVCQAIDIAVDERRCDHGNQKA